MKTKTSCASIVAASLLVNAAPLPSTYRVYFGTSATGEQCGIYMSQFEMSTGQLSEPIRVSDSARPGFIAIHSEGDYLYATEAGGSFTGHNEGAVSAYKIEDPSGTLTDINTQPSGGKGPCHVFLDPTGKNLLVANYRGGSCSVLPIQADGSLTPATSIQQHEGSSAHPSRQTEAHTHSITCSPDGRFALAIDLGMDQIRIYRLDVTTGMLTPNDPPFIATQPSDGPRHLTFNPAGDIVYVCMELSNQVTTFTYDTQKGTLSPVQTLSTLPADFEGENTTSEIITSPDGRFLYVGNRGHDSIAIFSIDPKTDRLTAQGYESTRGNHPRNFCIDPTGTFLIAANMNSDNVVVFNINSATGQLQFNGSEITVPKPTCVRFL